MDLLQVELKACKERWGKEIELSKAEKGAPAYPFPVALTRYTPQPESAAAWDIDELPVRLVFHGPDIAAAPVSVEVADYLGPAELVEKIESAIEGQWRKILKGKKDASSAWRLAFMLEWVEHEFAKLLSLCPQYMDSYVGCDFTGASMKRYVLVEPQDAAADDDDEDEDEEEMQRRLDEYVEREGARLEADWAAREADAELKRKQAESGIYEDGPKAKQLSKAEKAELNKSRKEKSGHRWRKTGSKSHKPDPEAKKDAAKKK